MPLTDQVADCVVRDQDLERCDAPPAVGGRDEILRDDPLQGARELHPDLVLLLGGEDVDDAVDRLRRALGVQRREDEVPGLGRGQRGRNRLEVAHLADQDDVRVLTQGGPQRVREARRVGADFALVDDAAAVPVEELDRILDREDVLVPCPVDLVDQRRERRRLAGAGGAGHEDEAARLLRELREMRRQTELVERLDLRRDHAERGAERRALEEDVHSEPGDGRERVREVDGAARLEDLLLFSREDPVDEIAHDVGCQLLCAVESLELAAHADHRLRAGGQMQIRRLALRHPPQQLIDRDRCRIHSGLPIGGRRPGLERFVESRPRTTKGAVPRALRVQRVPSGTTGWLPRPSSRPTCATSSRRGPRRSN
jgi:hypothetical protein